MKKIISLMLIGLFVVTLAACGGDTGTLDDILDCIGDPTAEGCEDLIPDPNDDRTAEEILADTIIENFDGNLTHITALLELLDFGDSMEVETEFSFSVIEDGTTNYIHVVMIDNRVEDEDGILLHRILNIDIDEEEITIDLIFQEVPTGVHVFLNFEPIKQKMIENGDQEVIDGFDIIGINEDWLMFKFDDSLENMVEIEVIKDIFVSAFFEEFGDTFFYDLQYEIDLELTIDPISTYGIDIGLFVDYLIDEDFTSAELMLDTIDYENLVLDLDMNYLVPEIVILLTDNKVELDLAMFTTDVHIANIEALGTEAWLDSLTEDEIIILADILIDEFAAEGDPDVSEMLTQYYAGTLDHYLVMLFLDDPDVAYELSMIPGFDSVAFTNIMDNLDYDAFYLEMVDVEGLFNAIYEGQAAFDLFVTDLAITAPEHASIFEAFSGIVVELEQYMSIVDDIDYAFENLSIFDEFFTLDYYLDNNILTTEIEVTDDFGILTTITLEPIAYVFIFQDLIDEAVVYLDGFQTFDLPYIEFINCPPGETCEPLPEYSELMIDLALLGEVEYTISYYPSNPGEVITKIDFTDFINKLVMMDETVTQEPVIELSLKVTVRENGTVTVPTEVSDINMIAEDFAKFSLSVLAYEALEDVSMYYMDNFGEFTLDFGDTRQLDTFEDYLDLSLAFDLNMSYVEVGGSVLAPDYSIQLFWHDGTPVFTGPVGLVELLDVVGPGVDGPPTADIYQYYVDKVDAENFNMTKLLFVYIFNETDSLIVEPVEFPVPTP